VGDAGNFSWFLARESRLLGMCLWGLYLSLASSFFLCFLATMRYTLHQHDILPSLRPKAMDPIETSETVSQNKSFSLINYVSQEFVTVTKVN
jgi:hypothetical protein